MNILFATDTNFVMPLTVCLTSLFENNKEKSIDVYILHSFISEDQREILLNLAKSYRQNIYLNLVDKSYFNDVPPLFRWTKEAYYRLLINEYLPKELSKILYLDCDTIINKPIDDLYNIDLEDKYLAMNEIVDAPKHNYRKRLGLNKNGLYFNSGVILFNLDRCRNLINYAKICAVIEEIGDRLKLIDQDVINIIFDGKVTPLDSKYNDYNVTIFSNRKLRRLFNHANKDIIDKTYIFHFTEKPWDNLYNGSCEEIWYKYLKLSPYKDLCFNKFNKLKYKILRVGIMRFLIDEYKTLSPYINKMTMRFLSRKKYEKLKNFYVKNIK